MTRNDNIAERLFQLKQIALIGMVSPRGLGDALQYYVTVTQLQKFFNKTEITFFCSGLKSGVFIFKGLNLNARLLDLNPVGSYFLPLRILLRSFLRKRSARSEKIAAATSQIKKDNILLKKIKTIIENGKVAQKYLSSYTIDKYSNSLIMKPFSFDASIFGGHTICGRIYSYIYKYEAFHSVTKGPLVTAPISISRHALVQYWNETSAYKNLKMIKRLKQSLQKFDFIYVRGPYSLRILRDYLSIDEEKTDIALDTGFGVKLIFPEIKAEALQQRKTLRILIIPRKDYFYYFYKKEDAYKLYLESLTKLILWISKNFDVQICLSSQTISEKYDVLSSEAAVNDLCNVLRKYSSRSLDDLKVIKPENLINAYNLFSSMDLVISSYMHGGIMALSLGIPAFFILPSMETKVLDVLSFLGLDVKSFFLDMFNVDSLKSEIFINNIRDLLENICHYKKITEHAVDRALITVEAPVKTLIDLLK